MLKDAARATFLIGTILTGGGCYESAFPLDAAPQTELDSRLMGGWRCMFAEPDSHSVFAMELKASGDRRYQATTMVAGGDLGRYEVYGSVVKGATLVNVRSLQAAADEKPWVYLRYELLKPNILSVRSVRETVVAGAAQSAVAVRESLEQVRDERDAYEDAFICLRLE